ncbi:hypothetical protein E2C01_100902 [Portunus trituberculatus]|uniref:Uncharacterized protein n=1 Tax=Portunus trituberculatus TaxID=210409 RepID=A0A5B7K848_PORTR|nr:hypothetical protein [Portunus trituberculatus]
MMIAIKLNHHNNTLHRGKQSSESGSYLTEHLFA